MKRTKTKTKKKTTSCTKKDVPQQTPAKKTDGLQPDAEAGQLGEIVWHTEKKRQGKQ
jgi:hypothetical protein